MLHTFWEREGEQCAEQPYLAVDIMTEGGRENSVQNCFTWQSFLTEGGRPVGRTALSGSGLSDRGRGENSGQNSLTWQWTFWQREGGRTVDRTALPGSGLSDWGGGRRVDRTALPGSGLSDGGGGGGGEKSGQNSLTWQWTFWQREGEQLTELLVVHRQRLSISVVWGVLSLLLSTLGQNVLHKATPRTEQNKRF